MSDSPRDLWAKILVRLSTHLGRPVTAHPTDNKYRILAKALWSFNALVFVLYRWDTAGLTWGHPTATWAP